jgi:hypothetical protein
MAKYVAQNFVAPSSEAQVLGAVFGVYLHNLRSEDLAPILAKHGVSSIHPNEWYPMQRMLDIQRDIHDSDENVSEKLVASGIQFAQEWSFPSETKSVPEALCALSRISNQVVRSVPDGYGFAVKMISEKHVWFFSNTPHTSDGVYGTLWGLVNRVKPKNDMFVVRIIDNPDPENHPGTCFDIKWGATLDEVD